MSRPSVLKVTFILAALLALAPTADAAPPLKVGFTSTSAQVSESAGTLQFELKLSKAPSSNVTVNYSLSDQSTTAGSDYTVPSGSVVMSGQTATIDIAILDDTEVEGDESFQLAITSVDGANLDNKNSTATVTITDDDTDGGGNNGGGDAPHPSFELVYAFPEVQLLRWTDPDTPELERSCDGGSTWSVVAGVQSYAARITDGSAGTNCHFRMRGVGEDWTYLDGTATAPGDAVEIPIWNAPRPVPNIDRSVSVLRWSGPEGASPFLKIGRLEMRLDPEPGESLAGTTIEVYLNEPAFQVLDGAGNEVHPRPFVDLDGFRVDEPGCVERSDSPVATVTVPVDRDHTMVTVPGVRYGANGFRFVVTAADGSISERAILLPVFDKLPGDGESSGSFHYLHDVFQVLLYGEDYANLHPTEITGFGAVPRYSPDCRDSDLPAMTGTLRPPLESSRLVSPAVGTTRWTTDLNSPLERNSYYRFDLEGGTANQVGRQLIDETDQPIAVPTFFSTKVEHHYRPYRVSTLRDNKNKAPQLTNLIEPIQVEAFSGAGTTEIRFQITDVHHNLEPDQIAVTNLTVDPETAYPAMYSADQYDPLGDFGWFVVELPFDVDHSNTLEFQAVDSKGATMNEIRELSGETAPVQAIITKPSTYFGDYVGGQTIEIDATDSIAPPGSFVWTGVRDASGQTIASANALELSFVAAATERSYVIRVIVADPDHVLPNPWSSVCYGSSNCDYVSRSIYRKPPRAELTSPVYGQIFTPGETIFFDGSQSYVPEGFQIWVGLVDPEPVDSHFPLIDSTTGLTGSFTAADLPRLKVIFAIYDPSAYSDPELSFTFSSLGSSGSATYALDSEVIKQATLFDLAYANPEVVRLVWSPYAYGTSIERKNSNPIDNNWAPVQFVGDRNLRDESVVPGQSYVYRHVSRGVITYLGGGAEPGETVTVPIWNAPRPVPSVNLSSFTWNRREGQSLHGALGQAEIELLPEPGESLGGSTIRVYLNEDTFDLVDPRGFEVSSPTLDHPAEESRDDTGCFVLGAAPVATLNVPVGSTSTTFSLSDVPYGTMALRFEIENNGETAERSLIVPTALELELERPQPLFFGPTIGSLSATIRASTPSLRDSADCNDADPNDFYRMSFYPEGQPSEYFFPNLNATGLVEVAPTVWIEGPFEYVDNVSQYFFGRRVVDQAGTPLDTLNGDYDSYGRPIRPGNSGWLDLDVAVEATNPVPSLADPEFQVFVHPVPASQIIADQRFRFRILDSWQDVDPESIQVTNLSLAEPVTAPGIWAEEQIRPQGDWGWFVAWLPLLTPGNNTLLVEATDAAGQTLSEQIQVEVRGPKVIASIAAPLDGSSAITSEIIELDGTSSIGPPDMEAKWFLLFYNATSGKYETSYGYEFTGLSSTAFMNHSPGGFKVRLVVATAGNMPADADGADLPCSIDFGDGECDSVEVIVTNSCCPIGGVCSATQNLSSLTLTFAEPSESFIQTVRGEPLHVEAVVDPGTLVGSSFVYRWWVTPRNGVDTWSQRRLVSPSTPDGTGYSADHDVLDLDFSAAGIEIGRHNKLFVEVAVSDAGCYSMAKKAYKLLELQLGIDAVAPARVTIPEIGEPNPSLTIYGRSLIEEDQVFIVIDTNGAAPYDFVDGPYWPNVDRSVSMPLPAGLGAGTYKVAAAADSAGTGISTWISGLELAAADKTITNEEYTSCNTGGFECYHSITPGQTLTGNFFDDPNEVDSDYYNFSALAGSQVTIEIKRVDESLSVFHPDSIDPELLLIDPDGLVDAGYGVSADITANDTNARITTTLPKSGNWAIVASTTRAGGDYTLSFTLTPPASGSFEAVPVFDRTVTSLSDTGSSTATLYASVFDPQGRPTLGATLDWQGDLSQVSVTSFPSSANGLGQAQFTMNNGAGAAVTPFFDWPYAGVKAAASDTQSEPVELPAPGPIAGFFKLEASGAVVPFDKPTAREAKRLLQRSPGNGEMRSAPKSKKSSALCGEPQKVQGFALPSALASIDGVTLEVLDAAGQAITAPVTGLRVREQTDLQARLVLFGPSVADGSQIEVPLPGSLILLDSLGVRDHFNRGTVVGSEVCAEHVLATTGENTSFTYELPTISQYLDPDFASFGFLEASTTVQVTQGPTGGIFPASALIELQPEAGEPASILWRQDKNHIVPEASIGVEEIDATQRVERINGPAFSLVDADGNLVPDWSPYDSGDPYHRSSSSPVHIASWGSEGNPAWTGVSNVSPLHYQPFQWVSNIYTDGGKPTVTDYSTHTWTVTVETPSGAFSDDFQIGTDPNMPWIFLDAPNTNPLLYLEQYVSTAELADLSNYSVSQGSPWLFSPSGKMQVFMINPWNAERDEAGASFDSVPVTIWVNGPNETVNSTLSDRDLGGDPSTTWVPRRVEDIELCTGWVYGGPNCSLEAVCDQLHQGEAELTVSSVPYDSIGSCVPDGQPLAQIVGVSQAPRDLGNYQLVVETEDPRFDPFDQEGRNWSNVFSHRTTFTVDGGAFYDENWARTGQPEHMEEPTVINFRTLGSDRGPDWPLQLEVNSGSTTATTSFTAKRSAFREAIVSYDASFLFIPLGLADPGSHPDAIRIDAPLALSSITAQEPVRNATSTEIAAFKAFVNLPIDFLGLMAEENELDRRILVSNCTYCNNGVANDFWQASDEDLFSQFQGHPAELRMLNVNLRISDDPEVQAELAKGELEFWVTFEDVDDLSYQTTDPAGGGYEYQAGQYVLDDAGDDNLCDNELFADHFEGVSGSFFATIQGEDTPREFVKVPIQPRDLSNYDDELSSEQVGYFRFRSSMCPGDNYKIVAFLRQKDAPSAPITQEDLSRSGLLTVWDRLIVEFDSAAARGFYLFDSLTDQTAGDQVKIRTFWDFQSLESLRDYIVADGTNAPVFGLCDVPGSCEAGLPLRPVAIIDRNNQSLEPLGYLRSVSCSWVPLTNPFDYVDGYLEGRRINHCTVELVEGPTGDAPIVTFPAGFQVRIDEGGGLILLGQGGVLDERLDTNLESLESEMNKYARSAFYEIVTVQGKDITPPASRSSNMSSLDEPFTYGVGNPYFESGDLSLLPKVAHITFGTEKFKGPNCVTGLPRYDRGSTVGSNLSRYFNQNASIVYLESLSASTISHVAAVILHEVLHGTNINEVIGTQAPECTETPTCQTSGTQYGNWDSNEPSFCSDHSFEDNLALGQSVLDARDLMYASISRVNPPMGLKGVSAVSTESPSADASLLKYSLRNHSSLRGASQ